MRLIIVPFLSIFVAVAKLAIKPVQAFETSKSEEYLLCSSPTSGKITLIIKKKSGIANEVVIQNSLTVWNDKNNQRQKDEFFIVYEADDSHYSAQQDKEGAQEAFSSIFINRITGKLTRINRISHQAVSALVDKCDRRITKEQCIEKMKTIPGGNFVMCLEDDLECETRRKGYNVIASLSYTCKAVEQQF